MKRVPNGEPERFYREVVLPHRGGKCLLWPFARFANGFQRKIARMFEVSHSAVRAIHIRANWAWMDRAA